MKVQTAKPTETSPFLSEREGSSVQTKEVSSNWRGLCQAWKLVAALAALAAVCAAAVMIAHRSHDSKTQSHGVKATLVRDDDEEDESDSSSESSEDSAATYSETMGNRTWQLTGIAQLRERQTLMIGSCDQLPFRWVCQCDSHRRMKSRPDFYKR